MQKPSQKSQFSSQSGLNWEAILQKLGWTEHAGKSPVFDEYSQNISQTESKSIVEKIQLKSKKLQDIIGIEDKETNLEDVLKEFLK